MLPKIEELYKVIKDTNEEILAIRKECKHEHTFIGTWGLSTGFNIDDCIICSDCRDLVSIPKIESGELTIKD